MIFADLNVSTDNIRSISRVDDSTQFAVTWEEYRPMRCDDADCKLEHAIERVTCGATIDVDRDFFVAVGMKFLRAAYGITATSTRTDFSDVDVPATLKWMVEQNIAGLPYESQKRIQALGAGLGNLILAASEDLDAALTGDRTE
jgi:hypothetical protein